MRKAVESDLPRIVEIYNSTIPSRLATADTEPVTVDERQAWFRRHTPTERPLYVLEKEKVIVGWISFESFYGRPAYHQTVELSIYLSPESKGQGLGRELLSHAIEVAPGLGVHNLVGYIFSHNLPSIELFKSFGFKSWGELPEIAVMDGNHYSLSILGLKV